MSPELSTMKHTAIFGNSARSWQNANKTARLQVLCAKELAHDTFQSYTDPAPDCSYGGNLARPGKGLSRHNKGQVANKADFGMHATQRPRQTLSQKL